MALDTRDYGVALTQQPYAGVEFNSRGRADCTEVRCSLDSRLHGTVLFKSSQVALEHGCEFTHVGVRCYQCGAEGDAVRLPKGV